MAEAVFTEIRNPKKRKILARVATTGRLTARGQKGADWSSHYVWLRNDPVYAAAYQRARQIAADMLEAEAFRRAFQGSDVLLIFLLKGHKPEIYRDRVEHTGKDGAELVLTVRYADPPPEDVPCPRRPANSSST